LQAGWRDKKKDSPVVAQKAEQTVCWQVGLSDAAWAALMVSSRVGSKAPQLVDEMDGSMAEWRAVHQAALKVQWKAGCSEQKMAVLLVGSTVVRLVDWTDSLTAGL
jgi:hypothetical protein